MHPLNPFLRAFFQSALPAQCNPANQHILLVPTTEVLLHAKDRDSNASYAELAGTEDFLASHVLRVTGGGPPGEQSNKDSGHPRENKTKARQYSTINGRTVIVKDAFVYSNKGFKTLNQAQLLGDTIYYPDTSDGQQWLVYYISRPLIGSIQSTVPIPAVISDEPSKERRRVLAEATDTTTAKATAGTSTLKKKDIKSFADVLEQFPIISRQMQSGLEKVIRDFTAIHDNPLAPTKRPRATSQSSHRTFSSFSDVSSIRSSRSGVSTSTAHPTSLELEPEEQTLRTSLETAIIAAIDLFQSVDKHQLSLLGASTELTGPAVERLIERYVVEQIHDQTLFRHICAVRKSDDWDLDFKIRKMSNIDIAQVGVPIEDGMKGKRGLAARLAKGIEAFKRMGVAGSPQEMLEILLNTQKVITENGSDSSGDTSDSADVEPSTPLTVNADVLVSMLLVVVIRSEVKHLHSRLLCMRYFIFTDEVEIGEQGYALATLEAVLSHLSTGSNALRRASKHNKLLWQSVRAGDIKAVKAMMRPNATDMDSGASPDGDADDSSEDDESTNEELVVTRNVHDGHAESSRDEFAAGHGSLQHIFPFQRPPTPPPDQAGKISKKRVSMASLPRSLSASSLHSSEAHSRNMSVVSVGNGTSTDDLSVDKLAQTQDADGNSVLMMAIDSSRRDILKFFLSMPAHFRIAFVLDDINHEGTTLLSAAVQSGNRALADELLDFLETNASEEELCQYFLLQDSKGRGAAHYLFHQPHLMQRFGTKLPWRQKDKIGQTPLFALFRSYDHELYHAMVDQAIKLATDAQGDGERLHLDDHIDHKGNTLLHIVTDNSIAVKLMYHCDCDVNATNDKRFTPLMVSSKYGRTELLRTLFGDIRVDLTMRDFRGLTAVELAKDDDVRNRIDDLVLLSVPPGRDGRMTTVVRAFFVEDATVRLVLKSGAPNPNGTITVTTCRRAAADFETLSKLLSIECPASWLPTHFNLPSPYLIPHKPSRAVLRDTQIRLDNFFQGLLTHGTFSTHELVWEFFLVPDIDTAMLSERTRRKAETRIENLKDDYEPVTDTQGVENFVAFARDQVKGVTGAVRRTLRTVNRQRMRANDLAEAQMLVATGMSALTDLPSAHARAYARYSKTLQPSESSPMVGLYYSLHSMHSTSTALQVATNRPAYLIGSMNQAQRTIDRVMGSLSRSNRWTPRIGGLFDETKKANALDAWDKAGKARGELEGLACELRYTQQTIAGELAVWQEEHVTAGRAMLRKLARESLVRERSKLDTLRRALREARMGS
jgi:ankyrin repeat protein